ncbi:hypothetical protein BDN70DRAFT_817894, partial [Pholiota conissans]
LITNGVALGPPKISMGSAANYLLLASNGISIDCSQAIEGGNVGLTEQTSDGVLGVNLTLDSSEVFASWFNIPQVYPGTFFAPDYLSPTPDQMSAAAADVANAFQDGKGRTNPDFTNFGNDGIFANLMSVTGTLDGLTLTPGLYKWTTNVKSTSTNVGITLSGSPVDTWIFQISGNLVLSGAPVNLHGGASPNNIFWVISGDLSIGTDMPGTVIVRNDVTYTIPGSGMAQGRLYCMNSVNTMGGFVGPLLSVTAAFL